MATEHFTDEELMCHCGCDRHSMDERFMDRLEFFRQQWGFPMEIYSGFRCPSHNLSVNGGPAHPLGVAVDVGVFGYETSKVFNFVYLALRHGFQGVGVKLSGDWKKRFVHLDMLLTSPNHPRPAFWTYP